MGDRALGVLGGRLNFRSILHSFLEMLDPFIYMWVLLSLFGMLESLFGMLFQGIGMLQFALLYGFLGMLQSLGCMLVISKGPPSLKKGTARSA